MRILPVLSLILTAPPAAAQQIDEQLWLQGNGAVAIDEKTKVTVEGIARFSDRTDDLFHTEFGAANATGWITRQP